MVKIVGVRFRNAGKVYYFDPKGYKIKAGDHVIVETARGVEYGTVIGGIREVTERPGCAAAEGGHPCGNAGG